MKFLPLCLLTVSATAALAAEPAASTPPTGPAKPAVPTATPAAPAGPVVFNRVRILAAPKQEKALVGGKVSGSNVSPTEEFKVLGEIKEAPAEGQWAELKFENATPYRWLRYEAPAGSYGNVAEVEFYDNDRRLEGLGFGPGGGFWKGALDKKPETFFKGKEADGEYVGIDIRSLAATARPAMKPDGGNFEKAQTFELVSPTPGATIRYTLDGTTPTATSGEIYKEPLKVDGRNTTIVAVAFKEGMAPSEELIRTIWIGKPIHPPMNSFHVGNSLTGNASRFATFIRTAGGTDAFPAYLIGGSLTVRLWNDSHGADQKRWEDSYGKAVHPLEYFTLQPRDFNVEQEVDYASRFIQLVREKSPEVQPWLYAEWVEMPRQRPTDQGKVASSEMKKTFPALTWEESMGAMLLYNEEVQRGILEKVHGGKKVRIIPTDIAFGWARNLSDHGKIPGFTPGEKGFYQALFDDQVHVNGSGCYLVACTWYAALYRESPEGKLLPIGTTLTSEQAKILQKLAWEVVKNYPDCGIYEDGKEACGAPKAVSDGKHVTLSSSTPEAWFRYTLDGTVPTRTNGYVYCGTISIQPGIVVKAVAFKSGMADSKVTEFVPSQD